MKPQAAPLLLLLLAACLDVVVEADGDADASHVTTEPGPPPRTTERRLFHFRSFPCENSTDILCVAVKILNDPARKRDGLE